MESIFSFLSSYFSFIVLAKGKSSKYISLFLGHIGPKQSFPIRLQDFQIKHISKTKHGNSLLFYVDTSN